MQCEQTLIVFTAACYETVDGDTATLTTRNFRRVLRFGDSLAESAAFTLVMPGSYAGSGFSVEVHYAAATADEGNVRFDVAFERIGRELQSIDDDGFADAVSAVDTVPSSAGTVGVADVTLADGPQSDQVAAGDPFRLKVTRRPDLADDTAAGNVDLLYAVIRQL